MDSKKFPTLFNNIATTYGFESAFGGWFRESDECLIALDLQKSNFGNYYELNIKVFVQGMFNNNYTKSKNSIKREIGHVFLRPPDNYKDVLDLDTPLNDQIRGHKIDLLFNEFIIPLVDKALTKHGLKVLEQQQRIYILPAVRKQLGRE